MWTAIAIVFLIVVALLLFCLTHFRIISSQKLQDLANIAAIAALVLAIIVLFLPKDNQQIVPTFVITKPKDGNFITTRSFSIEGTGANPAKPNFLKVKLINLQTNTSTVFENYLIVNSDTSWRLDNVEFQDPGPYNLVIDATYGAALDKEILTEKITIGVIYRPGPSITPPPTQNHSEPQLVQPTDKQRDMVCDLVLSAEQKYNAKDSIHQNKAFELLNQALALASTQGYPVNIQQMKTAQKSWDMGNRPEALADFIEAFHCD